MKYRALPSSFPDYGASKQIPSSFPAFETSLKARQLAALPAPLPAPLPSPILSNVVSNIGKIVQVSK